MLSSTSHPIILKAPETTNLQWLEYVRLSWFVFSQMEFRCSETHEHHLWTTPSVQLQDSLKCNVLWTKCGIKLNSCMQINIKFFFKVVLPFVGEWSGMPKANQLVEFFKRKYLIKYLMDWPDFLLWWRPSKQFFSYFRWLCWDKVLLKQITGLLKV